MRKIIAKVLILSARYKAKDASIWLKANVVWRCLFVRPRNQPKATPGLVHAAAVGVDVFLAVGLNMHIHNALWKLCSQIVLHFLSLIHI